MWYHAVYFILVDYPKLSIKMGSKNPSKHFSKKNHLILLQILCVFIGLLPVIAKEEPTISHDDRIAEAKAQLLKMIQKG